MQVHSPNEVARLAKQQREALGWSQSVLAERIGATRQWVIAFERGKPRLELGLALRAMTTLGLVLDVAPVPISESTSRSAPGIGTTHGTRADPALLVAPSLTAAPGARRNPVRRSSCVPAILTLSRQAAADPARIVSALRQPVAALTSSRHLTITPQGSAKPPRSTTRVPPRRASPPHA